MRRTLVCRLCQEKNDRGEFVNFSLVSFLGEKQASYVRVRILSMATLVCNWGQAGQSRSLWLGEEDFDVVV
jgi:hypothetical protein